jgi:poly-gamma-glutamate synthesis protein (capsule biosynthesis protein)
VFIRGLILFLVIVVVFIVWQMWSPEQKLPKQVVVSENVPKIELPLLSVGSFFDGKTELIDRLDPNKIWVLMATGDVGVGRSVNVNQTKYGFDWAFKRVGDQLASADLTLINLENPLVSNCPLTNEGMVFCGDLRNAGAFQRVGIDVVSLANNHAGNYGIDGVAQTIRVLENNGISVSGSESRKILYKDVKGTKVAIVGINDVTKYQPGVVNMDENTFRLIREARDNSELVIVTVHWGEEYQSLPTTRQRELAKGFVEAGADLIIGNHPHWIQGAELIGDKVVVYAHGNFIFDQEWSLETKTGVAGRYYFYENKLIDVEFLPVRIMNYGQPYWLDGVEKEAVLQHMKEISGRIN